MIKYIRIVEHVFHLNTLCIDYFVMFIGRLNGYSPVLTE